LRLNKYIAHNSNYSRREADRLIFDGKVKINNRTVQDPATDVVDGMRVSINGKAIKKKDKYTFIVYNKPKGELVTKKDPRGRKTIYHSLGNQYRGFSPVGRLDYASEGVLILSDAIDIVDKLMNSSLERVYKIKVNGKISEQLIKAMENGITITNSTAGAYKDSSIENMEIPPFNWYKIGKVSRNYSTLKVSISEGKNRELRRFFANFHLNILDLKRVSYGWINLNALPTGKKRFFTKEEYDELRRFLKIGNKNI